MVNDSFATNEIQVVISVLQQALERRRSHDHFSTHSLIATASDLLKDIEQDVYRYYQVEEKLKQMLK